MPGRKNILSADSARCATGNLWYHGVVMAHGKSATVISGSSAASCGTGA
ncbi:hypothetical protein [Oryzomonas sagensis]|nr:hypothetical protein [Oryzomonas sagensis]